MTKKQLLPHPNPPRVGEGILQIPFSSKEETDRMLLPLIGEGRDGEFPARDLFCRHSVLDTESSALGWGSSPSPDWGRLGWGVSRKGFNHIVILNGGAKRSVIQNPLHWGWTSSPSPTWGRPGWGVPRKGFVLSSLYA